MKYIKNQNNPIRIGSDTAWDICDLYFNDKEVIIRRPNNQILWEKRFDHPIVSIGQRLGNFVTCSEQIKIQFENEQSLIYSTRGSLLYNSSEQSSYFDYINEDFAIPILLSLNLDKGYYNLVFEVIANKQYELFDGRGMCIYEGNGSKIELRTHIKDFEVLQIKSRDNVTIANYEVQQIEREPIIYVAGDSTLTNQLLPYWSWSQLLQARLRVTCDSYAVQGRSTKSFMEENRFKRMLKQFKAGDKLIIGFGHNDEKPNYFGTSPLEYLANINYMRDVAESYGVDVIVVTPIVRRNYIDNELIETHSEYANILRAEYDGPLIDLNAISRNIVLRYGEEKSKELFVHSDLMKIYDNTHTSYLGASEICDCFVSELDRLNIIKKDQS